MEMEMKSATITFYFILLHAHLGMWSEVNGKEEGENPLLFHSEFSPQEAVSGGEEGGGERSGWGQGVVECTVGERCGEGGECCCEGPRAWCGGRGLAKIPLLPPNITWLDFSNNSLTAVQRHTLHTLPSLLTLILQANRIAGVHPEAFTGLTRLRVLHLGGNRLPSLTDLLAALAHAPQLQHLNASTNHFQDVDLSTLQAVPMLTTLLLSGNTINRIVKGKSPRTSRLRVLDVNANVLGSFPDFCSREGKDVSLLPELGVLNVEWNVITSMEPEAATCLPNLTALNMQGNALRHLQKNFLQGFPRLQNFSLRFCMTRQIDSQAFSHPSLQFLDISENLWFFDSHYGSNISPDLFQWLPQLQFINMSWTVFRFSKRSERQAVLSPLTHVKGFVLQGTGVDFIPKTILRNFTNLTFLSFGKNAVTFLPDDTFQNLSSLTSLDLSENHVTYVSQSLLENLLNRPNASVDLSQNPFACTCDLLWFIERYKEDYRRKEGQRIFSGGPYRCRSPDSQRNVPLAEVSITAHTCAFTHQVYIAILFVSLFTLVLLTVGAIAYKYRWQLRFMLYTIQHRLSRDGATRPAPHAVYDVFVSYDSADSDWVTHTLVPELEGRRGLRLCVHERDFTPGMFITHNIIEKMEESGAVMPLLSNSFLSSDWCRFEVFMALKLALRRGRRGSSNAHQCVRVLPILLESVEREGVDSLLCALLNTTTYLAWPLGGREGEREREREREGFWNTLCSVLQQRRGRGELGELP